VCLSRATDVRRTRFARAKTLTGRGTMKKNNQNLTEKAWDLAELLARVDNDRELLLDLLSIFKSDFPGTLQSLKTAVAAGDLKSIRSLSHTLKGMLANLAAVRAAAAAANLEILASKGEQAALPGALEAFECEAGRLVPELDSYMAEVQP
jgi:two-component system, sensor histidine kinase and response regulator